MADSCSHCGAARVYGSPSCTQCGYAYGAQWRDQAIGPLTRRQLAILAVVALALAVAWVLVTSHPPASASSAASRSRRAWTMNLSRSGLSASIGGRGFHQTYGPRGTRTTVGLPGTGAYVTNLNPARPSRGFTAGALVAAFGVGVLQAMLKPRRRRR